jgi:creatinine amidohydrolase
VRRLAELPYPEAAAARGPRTLVLIPIGATEAHGPHLPLGTDSILSEELARRAAARLEAAGWTVLAAPAVSYSLTDYAGEFAGTISISAETATALLTDVGVALVRQGFAQLCLVNNHLEPAHVAVLHEACRRIQAATGRPVAFPDQTTRRWARTLTDEYKRGMCHAGSYETSLVLAARPELVRDELRRALSPLPVDLVRAMQEGKTTFGAAGATQAYFGDPAAATREEGDAIYDLLVEMVVTVVGETFV